MLVTRIIFLILSLVIRKVYILYAGFMVFDVGFIALSAQIRALRKTIKKVTASLLLMSLRGALGFPGTARHGRCVEAVSY
jgi:hypothetical protein